MGKVQAMPIADADAAPEEDHDKIILNPEH